MEKQTFDTNFRVAVHWCGNHYILCNEIPEIDPDIWEQIYCEMANNDEDDEDYGDVPEIYQWYFSDCSKHDAEYLREHFGITLVYSDKFDLYILPVTHCGTSWDYVYWTTDNEYAKRELGEEK